MAAFLLDTNVLSETRRVHPDRHVVAWLQAQPDAALFTSVIVVGEILQGILKLETHDARRATAIGTWLDAIESTHEVLPIDRAAIACWAELKQRHPGLAAPEDMLIAATALAHGLTIATRNIEDFADLDVPLHNPWTTS